MDKLAGKLGPYLARFGRRLRLRDGWLLAQRSLWIACLAAALIQLAGRAWPLEQLWLWTLAPLVAWPLIMVGISLLRPLPLIRVARRVDAELALKERLTTALVLEERRIAGAGSVSLPSSLPTFQFSNLPAFQPSLIALQQQDALAAAKSIHPRRAFPLRWLRRSLLLAGVLAAAVLALAVLPNPMDATLAQRAAVAQAAEEQAQQIEKLREEIENAQELTPEAREELLRQLTELAEQLRANPGDREDALADLSRVEESVRQRLDPNAADRGAALESLAAQLQALAGGEAGDEADLSDAAEALDKLVEMAAEMSEAERSSLAQSLAQAAARAAQAGDRSLAQALAAMAQAVGSGDTQAAAQAAQAAAEAAARAEDELADQAALQEILTELQEGRQAIAQAGQGQALAQGQGQGQAQGQGQSQGQGQGQGQSQSQGQGGAQGQGQGQPGSAGGTKADTLPPARRTGEAEGPQGPGQPGALGVLDQQVYVPWERRPGSGDELIISGQETGQGEIEVREQTDPLPGAAGPVLVPYYDVYYDYLDAANQSIERSYIPPGLENYVRDYFSQLEP